MVAKSLPRPALRWWIRNTAQPLLLAAALALWYALDLDEASAAILALVGAQCMLAMLEHLAPAVPHWRQRPGEKLALAGLYLLTIVLLQLILTLYAVFLVPALAATREAAGLQLWPTGLPLPAQVLLLFLAADFIYYWIHRALHRFAFLWRASGHGFHHAFHNLHALNTGASHPLEILLLALPVVLVAALFGAGAQAVAGATVLAVVNTSIAHANLDIDTPALRWVFTNSNQHRRHHSAVFEASNSNYACNAILWDRLFGTYSEGEVAQTGIGPREPTLLEKLLLPFREPAYADTALSRRDAAD
ncbi:sterol desaturase family protein [Luteimonas viscosa]|nr:sterol desaturase family protein [Luteimonas viscosa]